MGLDISAYSYLRQKEVFTDANRNIQRFAERSLPQIRSEEELINITKSMIDRPDQYRVQDMQEGPYYETIRTKEFNFRAGSYSGYNTYRKMLSECFLGVTQDEVWANESQYEGKPFYEQVNFSDCEGFIGPEVSAKLAKDYRDGRARWLEYLNGRMEDVGYYIEVYDKWTRAFELASQDGVLCFY